MDYNVGDKVIITDNSGFHCYSIGEEVTIIEKIDNTRFLTVGVLGIKQVVNLAEFKFVKINSGVKVTYNKLRDNAVLPFRATEMSGGLDLTASSIVSGDGTDVVVYLGLSMQPPPGYMIRFSPRSSLTKYNWVLQNSPTLGDADFQGEYRLRFRAIPTSTSIITGQLLYEDFPYQVGDRVGQMWLEKIIDVNFIEGELENKTDRKGGFGSTNK